MQLVTITLNGQWKNTSVQQSLFTHMKHCIGQIHNKKGRELYKLHMDSERLVISANIPYFQLERDADCFYQALSKQVATWIIRELEPCLLRDYIAKEGYDEAHTEEIMKYCQLVLYQQQFPELDTNTDKRWDRKKKIEAVILEHVRCNTWLNLDGMLIFRLHFYTEELQDVVHYAIDEYIMEQQYQDFIHLLKYFVLVQESKMQEVHLLHRPDDQIEICNQKKEPIQVSEVNSFVMETIDQDIRLEDMIVSTLITIAPEKIYIHTQEPEVQVIKTIEQIFENRTEICTDCHWCRSMLKTKSLDRQNDPIYNN